MQLIEGINEELQLVNGDYEQLFVNRSYKSQRLTNKHYTQLCSKIYMALDSGPMEEKFKAKECVVHLVRSYIQKLVSNHVLPALEKAQNDYDFLKELTQKWDQFKRFTFYHFALLLHANNHFETAYKVYSSRGQSNLLRDHTSVHPIPVVALYCFKTMVLTKYSPYIRQLVLNQINNERNHKKNARDFIRKVFEILWSCGLSEVARIRASGQEIIFYGEHRQEILKDIKVTDSPEDYVFAQLLDALLQDSNLYYSQFFQDQIQALSPFDQITAISAVLQKEEELVDYYLLSQRQKTAYMEIVYQHLIYPELDTRLRRPGGLKTLLENYQLTSEGIIDDIQLYYRVLKRREDYAVTILDPIFREVISDKGNKINKKINKHRQHISDMLHLKMSVNQLLNQIMGKNLVLTVGRDRVFKKLLDGVESARNLADFTDFSIKECLKLKLDEEACLEKFDAIFTILANLSARDSFLIYHQEHLSKRLLESLNDPKIEVELLLLKKLAEQLGSISVSQHLGMLKDMENSSELTEKLNSTVGLSAFKWSLRIFNPSLWPDNASKSKLKIELPAEFRKQALAIQERYHVHHEYRYLNWRLERGISLFEGSFTRSKVRFQSENIYLMILLHISESPKRRILFGNLKDLFNAKENEESQVLQNYLLVLLENQLLLRHESKLPIEPGEELVLNMQYAPPAKNKANQIVSIKPTPETYKHFHKNTVEQSKILKDREKLVEAVLVKCLKHSHATGDNVVTFQDMFEAVKSHHYLNTFNFSEGFVKQRLEELISRDFCERDENDLKVYHYIA